MLNELKLETVDALIELTTLKQASPSTTSEDEFEDSVDPFDGPFISPHSEEMARIINPLSRQQKIELVALMWSGRQKTTFNAVLKRATEFVDRPDSYVVGHFLQLAPLAHYLMEGLRRLAAGQNPTKKRRKK